MASEAQTNANRENAQKSHGPTSSAGQQRCQMAPVTHGLTAATILLPADRKEAYLKSVANTFARLKPATSPENAMVGFIADNEWKLARAFVYEQGIIAKTRADFLRDLNPELYDPAELELIIDGHVQQTNSKIFLNMSSEVQRVQNIVRRAIADYEKVRSERELVETAQRNVALQSIMGTSKDVCIPHATVGTLYPLPFLFSRGEFVKGVGRQNVWAFDRLWTDPKVTPPGIGLDWGDYKAKMSA